MSQSQGRRDPNVNTNETLPQTDMAPTSGQSPHPQQQRDQTPTIAPDDTEAEHNSGSFPMNNPDRPADAPTPQ